VELLPWEQGKSSSFGVVEDGDHEAECEIEVVLRHFAPSARGVVNMNVGIMTQA